VTWTNLLANKEAQKNKTSKKELDNMRAASLVTSQTRALPAFRQIGDSRLLTTQHSRPRTWRFPVRDTGS
jgi:hypothetical protein